MFWKEFLILVGFVVGIVIVCALAANALNKSKINNDPRTTTVTRYSLDGAIQQWENTTYPERDGNRIWFYTLEGRLVEVYGDVTVEY